MYNLFIDFLEMTLPVSALIALLFLFSPLLKRSYAARWRYYMWLFTALRLIFPIKAKSRPPIVMHFPAAVAAEESAQVSPLRIIMFVWLTGIIALTAYQIIRYVSFKRLVKRWSAKVSDENINYAFEGAKRAVGIKQNIEIRMCKAVATPMIFGIIKPVLLLPYIDFAEGETGIVLRHELVHYKHRDIWYKLILIAARTIHWFNPMVYLMVRTANRDMELACDAEVVKPESADFRRQYCEAIMRLVHNGRAAGTPISTCFIFSKKAVMERFGVILDFKAKRSGIFMFCIVGVSVILSGSLLGFAVNRVSEEIEDNMQIIEREPEPARVIPAEAPPASADTTEADIVHGASNESPRSRRSNGAGGGRRGGTGETAMPGETYGGGQNAQSADGADADGESVGTVGTENADSAGNTGSTEDLSSAENVGNVKMGAEREAVYGAIGEPDTVSSDGSKETYSLSDGSRAVAQYDDGGKLAAGYIVVD